MTQVSDARESVTCPECGHVFEAPPREEIDQVDGALVEVVLRLQTPLRGVGALAADLAGDGAEQVADRGLRRIPFPVSAQSTRGDAHRRTSRLRPSPARLDRQARSGRLRPGLRAAQDRTASTASA